jgi:hypothetical protein
MEVIHFGGNAIEIPDAVVVAVGKTAGINLIENGVLPPLVTFGIDGLRLSTGEIRASERQ